MLGPSVRVTSIWNLPGAESAEILSVKAYKPQIETVWGVFQKQAVDPTEAMLRV